MIPPNPYIDVDVWVEEDPPGYAIHVRISNHPDQKVSGYTNREGAEGDLAVVGKRVSKTIRALMKRENIEVEVRESWDKPTKH